MQCAASAQKIEQIMKKLVRTHRAQGTGHRAEFDFDQLFLDFPNQKSVTNKSV